MPRDSFDRRCRKAGNAPRKRVIGLGNVILTDDGFGVHAARAVAKEAAARGIDVDVVETDVAGLALMELMVGHDHVVLIDALELRGVAPGTVLRLEPSEVRGSLRLVSVHDMDVATSLALGAELGFTMPARLSILGVQGGDMWTFGERLTPTLDETLPKVVEMVLDEVRGCGSAAGSEPC